MKITETYTLDLNGEEVDVEFEVEADIYYQKGRFSGPPEDCYPDEGECNITEVTVLTEVKGYTSQQLADILQTQHEDEVHDDLWDAYYNKEDEYDEDYEREKGEY